MTLPKTRERLLLVILLLQALTLVMLVPGLVEQSAAGRSRKAALRRAEELAVTGAGLSARGHFAAARRAYGTAARLAAGAGEIASAEEHDASADEARARSVLADAALPKRSHLQDLEALVTDLEAAGRRAAAAALEAACLEARGLHAEAKGRLERAQTEEGLASPWLDWRLGALLLRQRQLAAALPHLERAERGLPHLPSVVRRLGLAYEGVGRPEDAVSALQRAIEGGGGPAASLDLASVYVREKQWADAVPHLQTVVRARPDNVRALRLLALAQFRLDRFLEAADIYRKAHSLKRSPRTLLSVAISLHAAGAHREALDVIDTLRPRGAEMPEILFQRALVLLKLGRRNDALADLHGYLEAARDRPEEDRRRALAQRHIDRLRLGLPGPPGTGHQRP